MSRTVFALADACGEDPGAACEAVWDATGNEHLARLADWFIGRPLTILGIVVVAWVAARVARRGVRRVVYRIVANENAAARALSKAGLDQFESVITDPRRHARATSLSSVLSSTAVVLIWAVALMLVVGELGINLAPLLASAGIAGVALGFGAQSLVKDCITGTFMLIEDQYGIGDTVDLGEATGTVEKISLRTTVLRSQDGTVWHVPNGEILRVGNKSQQFSVAVLDVTVGPRADVDQVAEIIESAAREHCATGPHADVVLEPPQLLGVEAVRPEGITFRLLVRTKPGEQFALQRSLRRTVQQALAEADVPAPTVYPAPPGGAPTVP
ncbi:MAG: mechanosensitive ion channel family protein [Desertimonas sp.]